MKTAARILAPLAFIALAAQAAPALAVSDGSELFLTATVGARYDDNVYLASGKNVSSDTVLDVTPGLDFVYGNGSVSNGHIYYKESWSTYADHSNLKSNLSDVGLAGKFDDPKLKASYNASFTQMAQNTFSIRAADTLVRRDAFNMGGSAELSVTDKTSVSAGVTYEDTNYKAASFVDSRITSIPLNAYFKIDAKLESSVGLTYRETRLQNNANSKDYFLNLGARGEFSPKLSGKLAVGYVSRSTKGASSENSVGLDSSLIYAYSPKTSIDLSASNDFGVSGQGQTQRNASLGAGVTSQIAPDWSAGARVAYRNLNYIGANARSDDFWEGSLNATYIFNAVVNITGSYTTRRYDTKIAGAGFSNNVFAIVTNIRY